MHQHSKYPVRNRKAWLLNGRGNLFILLAGFLLVWATTAAQTASQPSDGPKTNQGQGAKEQGSHQTGQDDFRLKVETDLVVLHATVLDKNSKPITDLGQNDFTVLEDNVPQRLKVFKREDIPVSVGILVDNSGSMRDKRKGVNAAALKFVQNSNPRDEVFIVNFNDEAYLDADFTDNIKLLQDALDRIDARGGTALYDALQMSLKYVSERGTRDKKVVLIVTDGEDNASRLSLEQVVKGLQRSNVVVYTVGLLGEEGPGPTRRAKRALVAFSKASGGAAYFPKNPAEVDSIATAISSDIRNQYVLAYTPTNSAADTGFRKVEVKVSSKKYGKVSVRTRNGYYPGSQSQGSAPS